MFLKNKKKQIQKSKGFSLIELIVVVSIFLIISSITLFKQSKFSSDILITNTAYEVALAIREAQVFGSGSKQGEDTSANRSKSYGIFFDDGEAKNFLLFSEEPVVSGQTKLYDSMYDPSNDAFSVEDTITLNRDQKINDFCGIDGDDDEEQCASEADIEGLSISFVKPNLNPIIKGISGAEETVFSGAKIIVQSDLGDKCRTIFVNNVGQISVQPVSSGESGCNN